MLLNPVGIRQRERGLHESARLSAEEYPQVNQIVQNNIYVDGCLPVEKNVEKALQGADELELMLNCVSFTLKGVTFTGGDPTSALSTDDTSVNVAGIKWFPKKGLLAYDIDELNFAKKQHGKKPVQHQSMALIDKMKLFQKWLKSLT